MNRKLLLEIIIYPILVLSITLSTSCEDAAPNRYQPEDYELSKDGTILEVWNENLNELDLREDPAFNHVTKIQAKAFEKNCSGLKKIILPENLKVIGKGAFRGIRHLETVVFPEGLEKIEEEAFMYCREMMTLTLPNSIKTMERNAFAHCNSLEVVNIPEHLEVLSYCTFTCVIFRPLVIPSTIKRIESFAMTPFNINSGALIEINPHKDLVIEAKAFGNIGFNFTFTRIKINSEIPPANITDLADSYEGSSLIRFYVPNSALEAYKADANWKKLNIQPFSDIGKL